MAKITFQGNEVETVGNLPAVGSQLPSFNLLKTDLSETTDKDYRGKKLILNIMPSVDTGVCSKSLVEFNRKTANRPETVVMGVSVDLPFAVGRHNTENKVENLVGTSAFRSDFGTDYGVKIKGGALDSLLARAVVVADENGKVLHAELVSEIANEPNYEAALNA